MPFDSLSLAAVTDEVRTSLVGGRIQRILQPSELSLGLSVYAGGREQWLLISASPTTARVHLSSGKLAKAFAEPSPFIMLLRKHLEGHRVATVVQVPYERVMSLSVQHPDGEVHLFAEIMGKHSNIILVGPSNVVLGAVKHVPPRESRVRPILPGRQYHPPPPRGRDAQLHGAGDRVDPFVDRAEAASLLSGVPAGTPVRQALVGLLAGCGPFMADQIALRADIDPKAALSGELTSRLVDAAAGLYELFTTRAWQPCLFRDSRNRLDFAPFVPAGVGDVQPLGSMSEAVEAALGLLENRDVLKSSRAKVIEAAHQASRAAQGRLSSLQEALVAAEEAGSVLEDGQLLLAYQHLAEPKAESLYIPDLGRTIPLDPKLTTVAENAERRFRRYRKLQEAKRKLPDLIRTAEADRARFEDIEAFASIADSESDLRALERDLSPQPQKEGVANRRSKQPAGPPSYSLDGYTAMAGRNARENERVTFKESRPGDLWLHARGRTGAHVILRGGTPPEEIVGAAASLAAYLSAGRSDTAVDVDVAPVRNVRKIPGGPPGRVTYRDFRTIRVRPEIGDWKRAGR